MYVIGTNCLDFIKVKSIRFMDDSTIGVKIYEVLYDCNLEQATFFKDYETAIKTIKEIKDKKDEILFENDSILGKILDGENKFDVETLKVYQLVVTECDTKNL